MVYVNRFTGSRRQACSKDVTLESVLAKIKKWDWATIGWAAKRLPFILLFLWILVEGCRILAVSQGIPVDRMPLLDWPLKLITHWG